MEKERKIVWKYVAFLAVFSLLFFVGTKTTFAAGEFITTWKTDNPGTSDSDQITIPTFSGETYNYHVDWGDSTSDDISDDTPPTHTYDPSGTYTVTISGTFPRIYFNGGGDSQKILSVEQWGTIAWSSMNSAFFGASNLVINASDAPDLSTVTDMGYMFQNATSFNQDISSWDVSNVINMNQMFFNANIFNQPLSSWEVSNVTNMSGMLGFTSFNQDISAWDISNVTNMGGMFNSVTLSLTNYDALLAEWSLLTLQPNVPFDAGNSIYYNSADERQSIIDNFNWTITDGGLFVPLPFITTWKTDNPGTSDPNQITIPTFSGETYNYHVDWGDSTSDDISDDTPPTHTYDPSGTYTVTISGTFPRIYFNGGGDSQKILSVEQWGDIAWTSMDSAFYGCSNLVINALDIPDLSTVTSMYAMFTSASSLNSDISSWDVSQVTNMAYLFDGALAFNQPLSSWNVENVTNMSYMFATAASFNQPLSSWNVENVTNMNGMFASASLFNQDLSIWDVSHVTDMGNLFNSATAFNQDISIWDTVSVAGMSQMFYGATSFDQDLSSWDVSSVSNMSSMFSGVTLSTDNYDALLAGWSLLTLQQDVSFDGGNSYYCNSADERQSIIDNFNWSISDGGVRCPLYWFNGGLDNEWNTLADNWWDDEAHTMQSVDLPDGTDPVITLGTTGPNVDLDVWTPPLSIDATETGISFTSAASNGLFMNLTGDATFNGSSNNQSTITGDATFNDTSVNYGTVSGDGAFYDSSYNNGGIIEGDATFYDNLTENNGTVNGTKIRRYTSDILIHRDFVDTGPWTVVADGAVVNIYNATYDGTTTFETLDSGSFVSTAPPTVSISSCAEFEAINDNLFGDYVLTTNLDCESEGNDIMVATDGDSFHGSFDGDGHTISNILIDTGINRVGLFGVIAEGGLVENLGVVNANVTSSSCDVGALAGQNNGTIENSYSSGVVEGSCDVGGLVGGHNGSDTIINSHSSATVSGQGFVGGLVGRNYSDGNIIDSYATGDVIGTGNYIGGFAGYNSGIIRSSYATGGVNGYGRSGGFVGTNSSGNIYNSYSTGSVSGNFSAGGFIGFNIGDIYFSYSTGNVTGSGDDQQKIGGFAGYNGYDSIYSSYSTGSVTASDDARRVGGFIGWNDHYSFENSGWWTGAGPENAIRFDTESDGPVAHIEYNESNKSAFKNSNHDIYTTQIVKDDILYDHWDFEEVWGINEDENGGYPFLQWQGFTVEEPTHHGGSSGGFSHNPANPIIPPLNNLPNNIPPIDCLSYYNFSPSTGQSCHPPLTPPDNNPNTFQFLINLSSGTINNDVKELQKFLNTHGYVLTATGAGSPGNETSKFGALTKKALIKFQIAHNITPSVGFFGPITRGVVNINI